MGKITRRLFCKVGCAAMAAIPLAFPGIANSQEVAGKNGDLPILINYNPLMPDDFKIKFKGRDGYIEVNKHDKNGSKMKKSLVINGRAATVLQFCRGRLSSEKIVEMYSKVYRENPENVSGSVLKYIEFLFDNGFVVFVAPSYLSEDELKKGRGITVPIDKLSTILVVSESDKQLNLTF